MKKGKGRNTDAVGRVCKKRAEEEMRFSLIFHGSNTLWIFICGCRETCETCFAWPLTDYLFVNNSHHFSFFLKYPGKFGNMDSAKNVKTHSKLSARNNLGCQVSFCTFRNAAGWPYNHLSTYRSTHASRKKTKQHINYCGCYA